MRYCQKGVKSTKTACNRRLCINTWNNIAVGITGEELKDTSVAGAKCLVWSTAVLLRRKRALFEMTHAIVFRI